MKYIVNEDGEYEGELHEGDSILRKKSKEYLENKVKYITTAMGFITKMK